MGGDLRKEFGEKVKAAQPPIPFETIGKPIPLPGDASKGIFVVYIPESLRRPHMTNPEGVFYRRDAGGNAVVMDYYQLRDMMMLRRPALLADLQWELEENAITLCYRFQGDAPAPVHNWLANVRTSVELPASFTRGTTSALTARQAMRTAMFWTFSPSVDRLRVSALRQAIHSGEFLVLNPESGRLTGGELYDAMQTLTKVIEQYAAADALLKADMAELDALHKATQQDRGVSIRTDTLHTLFMSYDRQQDVLRLAGALLAYIAEPNMGFQKPALNRINPIPLQAEQKEAETPTHANIQHWFGNPLTRQILTGEKVATTAELVTGMQEAGAASDILTASVRPHLAEYVRRREEDGENAAVAWLQGKILNKD